MKENDLFGLGFEVVVLGALTSVAFSVRQDWEFVLATAPYSYIVSYCMSRAAAAYARKSPLSGDFLFEVHRFFGSFCVLYSLVSWYKLIALGGRQEEGFSPQYVPFVRASRVLAVASTLFNALAGISLFPHINRQTPLILRQIFTLGTSLGIASFLLWVVLQLRAKYPDGNVLVDIAAAITVAWNVLCLVLSLCAATILAREKKLTKEELEGKKKNQKKKAPPSSVLNYYNEIFFQADIYEGTMSTKEGLSYIPGGKRWVAQFVTVFTTLGPGAVMGLTAVNLAVYPDLPALGGARYNPRVVDYSVTVLELLAFSTIPANIFDLSLVLRRRLGATRAAFELLFTLLPCIFWSIPMSFVVLDRDDAKEFMAFNVGMAWPLLGSPEPLLESGTG